MGMERKKWSVAWKRALQLFAAMAKTWMAFWL
jgi:hypothetical protein